MKGLIDKYVQWIKEGLSFRQIGDWAEITTPFLNHNNDMISIFVKKNGKLIFDGLGDHGIMTDWREPDVIRVAPIPFYNNFEEIHRFAEIFKNILDKLMINRKTS